MTDQTVIEENLIDHYEEDPYKFNIVMGGLPPVAGTVLEVSDSVNVIDASRVSEQLYKREASSLPREFGSRKTMENLEKIDLVLEKGVAQADGFNVYRNSRLNQYRIEDYGHEDLETLLDAGRNVNHEVSRRKLEELEEMQRTYTEGLETWR